MSVTLLPMCSLTKIQILDRSITGRNNPTISPADHPTFPTIAYKNQIVSFGTRVNRKEHPARCAVTVMEYVLTLELNKV